MPASPMPATTQTIFQTGRANHSLSTRATLPVRCASFTPLPSPEFLRKRSRKILSPFVLASGCTHATRQRAGHTLDASRNRPGRTSHTAFGRHQNAFLSAENPCANQYLISPRYRNHPRNRRTQLRRVRRLSKLRCSGPAGWKNQVCQWTQLFRQPNVCPCKSKLSVRRYAQRSWTNRRRLHPPTNLLERPADTCRVHKVDTPRN